MKRLIAGLALALPACGGGNVAVALVPEDIKEVTSLGTTRGGLSDPAQTPSVHLTIDEVSVQVAGLEKDGSGEGSWQRISDQERVIDLHAVPIEDGEFLGAIELPAGRITQLRLRLKPTGDRHGQRVLKAAVVEANGAKCDLLVPQSAFEPGLKLTGEVHELDVDPIKRRTLMVSFGLTDASRFEDGEGCGWRLAPVLQFQRVRE